MRTILDIQSEGPHVSVEPKGNGVLPIDRRHDVAAAVTHLISTARSSGPDNVYAAMSGIEHLRWRIERDGGLDFHRIHVVAQSEDRISRFNLTWSEREVQVSGQIGGEDEASAAEAVDDFVRLIRSVG